jgi:putative transposase
MHEVATVCRVLGVSTSGYYGWRTRPRSERARADAELSLQIGAIHQRSRATYGAPRIHVELAEQGIRIGRKRVARLMAVAGIYGVSRRKWITTTTRDHDARPAPDLVERNFRAPARTSCGFPTSLTFPPGRAFYIWPWCSTCSAAE